MSARFVVHSLDHARAAVAAAAERGRPVTLMSAPGAPAYLGAPVFREIAAAAASEHPGVAVTAVFDCGEEAGLALQALREGAKVVRLRATPEITAKIASIARQTGARLEENGEPPAVDLLDAPVPLALCRARLAEDR
jgi:fructose/tagatose bisphosphate aldolase